MEILSILGLILIAGLFGTAAYFSYIKDWRFGFYCSLIICAAFFCVALPTTRAFMRTTAWAALVTALESTGQGLSRLSSTIDDIRERMTKDQANLEKIQKNTQEMQGSLKTAQDALQQQQRKLSDIDQLVKSIYEARKSQIFDTKLDSADLVVFEHDDKHATVYALLPVPPIPQTVDLQWHVYVQPRNSFWIQGNLVIFRWGQSVDSLRAQQLTITYVADPKKKPTLLSSRCMVSAC